MPLEGHFQRVNTPLRKLSGREIKVLVAGTVVTVVALLALILATASDSRPAPAPGCVSTVVAGRVGGEPVNGCRAEARAIFARSARFGHPPARTIPETLPEAGIKASLAAPRAQDSQRRPGGRATASGTARRLCGSAPRWRRASSPLIPAPSRPRRSSSPRAA